MAKKAGKKRGRHHGAAASSSSRSPNHPTAPKRKAPKKAGRKTTSRGSAAGKTYCGKGEVFLRAGSPLCRIPGHAQKRLGVEEEIPVRVTLGETSFFALLKTAESNSALFSLGHNRKPDWLEFYLYRSVRAQLELTEGMRIEVVVKREKHPRHLRGKLIR